MLAYKAANNEGLGRALEGLTRTSEELGQYEVEFGRRAVGKRKA